MNKILIIAVVITTIIIGQNNNYNQNFKKIVKIEKNIKNNNSLKNKEYIITNKQKNKIKILNKKNLKNKKIITIKGKITSNIKTTNNNIFFNINDRKTLAININRNKYIWGTITSHAIINTIANQKIISSNNKIYQITSNKIITILNKNTGDIIASKNIKIKEPQSKINTALKFIKKIQIYKNNIYICYSDGDFISINGTSGEKVWQKTKKNYKDFNIKKNDLIILKNNGNITSLNSISGKKKWTNRTLNSKKIKLLKIIKKIIIIVEKNNTINFIDKNNGYIIKSVKIRKFKIRNTKETKNKLLVIKNKNKIFKIKIKK